MFGEDIFGSDFFGSPSLATFVAPTITIDDTTTLHLTPDSLALHLTPAAMGLHLIPDPV